MVRSEPKARHSEAETLVARVRLVQLLEIVKLPVTPGSLGVKECLLSLDVDWK